MFKPRGREKVSLTVCVTPWDAGKLGMRPCSIQTFSMGLGVPLCLLDFFALWLIEYVFLGFSEQGLFVSVGDGFSVCAVEVETMKKGWNKQPESPDMWTPVYTAPFCHYPLQMKLDILHSF